jgi:dienelactone hydrolase
MRRSIGFISWVTILCGLVPCARADAPSLVRTIDELWSGFDPRALPLEIEVVKAWDEGDVHLEMIYFTGEDFEGEKTRVFGYLGRPRKVEGKIPGLLHIHGGGQTAYVEWPRFWAKRGYACLSFDFCGDTNLPTLGPEYRRERFTLWKKVPADMMKVGGGMTMTPDPRRNPWLHWAMAARRGLTLLETRPEVDASRLGIFGVSVGGTLTWVVAGIDPRVKAATPIYGCGWESYPFPLDIAAPASEDQTLWRTLMAPEAYAPRIKAPLLFLSASNDGHGKMDLAFRSLDRLASPVRSQLFSANYDHHIEPAEARSLPLWMDAHLKHAERRWPTTPTLEIEGAGIPKVRVVPEDPERVERVDLYYCLNNDWPMARFWRTVSPLRREADAFVGETPFLEPNDELAVFANVSYRDGVRLSTRLLRRHVAQVSGARPTLARQALIGTMDTSTDWSWVPAYTDPNREGAAYFTSWTSDDGERGFTLDPALSDPNKPMPFYFGTRKIGDPQFRGRRDDVLLVDVLKERVPESLTILLRHRLPGESGREYRHAPLGVTESQPSEHRWRTLRLTRDQFIDDAKSPLPSWEHVDWFILKGTSPTGRPPVFKRLRWENRER